MESKIEYYENQSYKFDPLEHFTIRIEEMKKQSSYGKMVASKWMDIYEQILTNEGYPVVHPIGQETFSLYAEFPTGVFEYALDIDGATEFIKENNIEPLKISPKEIIQAVDTGNINRDPNLIKPNHKNPIMILQSKYLTDNHPYCINGNHRIFEAERNNDKEIEVYLFSELKFDPFFYDTFSKAIYFFEIDYWNVILDKRYLLNNENEAFAYRL
ncbi:MULTISPECIES: hypothetical protein [Allobacillus]|uniref:Uncharacterized protein n=1 Tax=Allobacillus salarius TaxID=1955272 RepID=A0A556PBW1_9BACI|nr:hypothetical protein [Allobacillus salarius]TSJ61865.1 hypothetical protein FPQ13_10770 [Allobacillus salarius]